jgi:hypothetical protein
MAFKLRNQNVKRVVGGKHPFAHSASQSGTEPHAHPHESSSQFSTTLPTGTRSTFQGTTSAQFDPSSVTLTEEVKGKNFLETTSEGDAAYNALTPEQRKAQDNRVLKMQQEEDEKVAMQNQAIEAVNQSRLQQAEQEFNMQQQNQATSQQFTIGDATEAQEQQASMSEFETFQSELGAARTAALENAGDMFSKTYVDYITRGKSPEYARNMAAEEANKALARASYFTQDQFTNKQNTHEDFFPGQQFEQGQQIQYVQGTPDQRGLSRFGTRLFDQKQLSSGRYGSHSGHTADPTDLYGITESYFDAEGKPIDRDKYYKLKKRGKDPKLELTYGSELQKYLKQFQ